MDGALFLLARFAAGGTRRGLTLWRLAPGANSAAVLDPGSCRRTRCVRCAHAAQTASASMTTKRTARAAPKSPLLAATEIAPAGYRLPRSGRWHSTVGMPTMVLQRGVRPGCGAPLERRVAQGSHRAAVTGSVKRHNPGARPFAA